MISPILSAKDIDHSVKFYTEQLGFQHDFSIPGPDSINIFAFVRFGPDSNTFVVLSSDEYLDNGGFRRAIYYLSA